MNDCPYVVRLMFGIAMLAAIRFGTEMLFPKPQVPVLNPQASQVFQEYHKQVSNQNSQRN